MAHQIDKLHIITKETPLTAVSLKNFKLTYVIVTYANQLE